MIGGGLEEQSPDDDNIETPIALHLLRVGCYESVAMPATESYVKSLSTVPGNYLQNSKTNVNRCCREKKTNVAKTKKVPKHEVKDPPSFFLPSTFPGSCLHNLSGE